MSVQRKVKDEFGVRISLDDDNASAMLMAYASRSQSDELRSSGDDLALSLIPNKQLPVREQASVNSHQMKQRVYRGQVIENETERSTKPNLAIAQQEVSSLDVADTKRTVIYRGNRITV